MRTAFTEQELLQIGVRHYLTDMPIYARPISSKENFKLFLRGELPYWLPIAGRFFSDFVNYRPREIPDNMACHTIADGGAAVEYASNIGKGWFDLEWVYVPQAGGATVMPGKPKIEDMSRWEDVISIPDLDLVDWESMRKNNEDYLDSIQVNELCVLNGCWERLMSLMDVEGAAIAIIDEDQKEGIHRFFDRYSDFLIELIRRVKAVCPIDGVFLHDDWGHQSSTFFSLATAREMLVPYLKKIVTAVHDMGMFFELHSCGKNETMVPAFIECGVDIWCPQDVNDIWMLTEKYPDAKLVYGDSVPPTVPADADDSCVEAAARAWFEKYRGKRVIPAFRNPDPRLVPALYKVSRIAYCEDELTKQ